MSVHVLPPVDPNDPVPCPGFLTTLILRVGQGDEAALGSVFDVALPLVLVIVRRSATSPVASDTYVVEAFARIWRHAPTYVPASQGAVEWLVDQVLATVAVPERLAAADDPDVDRVVDSLSTREREVVALIALGLTNQEIAERLFLSINSVKTHIRSAYRRIGVTRRSQAVIWGIAHQERISALSASGTHGGSARQRPRIVLHSTARSRVG